MCIYVYVTFSSVDLAERFIYINEEIGDYDNANKICKEQGYLHLAVMDTTERQNMFSIAMAVENRKWVKMANKEDEFEFGSQFTSIAIGVEYKWVYAAYIRILFLDFYQIILKSTYV